VNLQKKYRPIPYLKLYTILVASIKIDDILLDPHDKFRLTEPQKNIFVPLQTILKKGQNM
jgi:hypothetical protein